MNNRKKKREEDAQPIEGQVTFIRMEKKEKCKGKEKERNGSIGG